MGSLGQGTGLIGKKRSSVDGKILTYQKPTAVNSYTQPIKAISVTATETLANSISDATSPFDGGVQNINDAIDGNTGTYARGLASYNESSVSGIFEVTYNVPQTIQQIHIIEFNDPSTNLALEYFNGAWVTVINYIGGATRNNFENVNATNVTKVRARLNSGVISGSGFKQLLLTELAVVSADAGKSIDNNNATEHETTSMLQPYIYYEMSAAIDKKPSAFYCRLGNNTDGQAIALELSTDALLWDRFNEYTVGADLVKGQDSFVEINLPTKDYRYYRWIIIDNIARKLAIAETRFFAPTSTQVQYEHGHKKLY